MLNKQHKKTVAINATVIMTGLGLRKKHQDTVLKYEIMSCSFSSVSFFFRRYL
jgi:hypothetical protein